MFVWENRTQSFERYQICVTGSDVIQICKQHSHTRHNYNDKPKYNMDHCQ